MLFLKNGLDTNGMFKLKDEASSDRFDDGWCATFFSLLNIANISMSLFIDLYKYENW